jgi:hypothetical protein
MKYEVWDRTGLTQIVIPASLEVLQAKCFYEWKSPTSFNQNRFVTKESN